MYKFLILSACLGLALASPLDFWGQLRSVTGKSVEDFTAIAALPEHENKPIPKQQQIDARSEPLTAPEYPVAISPLAVAAIAGVFPWIKSWPVAVVYKAVRWFLTFIPSLIVGAIVTLGICNLTPFCRTFDKYAFQAAQDFRGELLSLATPARLAKATELVTFAVQKYQAMQDPSNASKSVFQLLTEDTVAEE